MTEPRIIADGARYRAQVDLAPGLVWHGMARQSFGAARLEGLCMIDRVQAATPEWCRQEARTERRLWAESSRPGGLYHMNNSYALERLARRLESPGVVVPFTRPGWPITREAAE